MSRRLGDLLTGVDVMSAAPGALDVEINNVTQRSDLVTPGALFCCRRGTHADGHSYAAEAVRSGATALLVERQLAIPVSQIVVRDMDRALGLISAEFWGHPSRKLRLVGVTGTNGKTTTTYLVQSILELHGWPTGVIGTLSGPLTTPDPPELQRRLAEMVEAGLMAAAMEVSSHGLHQRRVEASQFAVGVFTNLDRDHLDYHGDMESYFAAKASLFHPSLIEVGVVNRDDSWGSSILDRSVVDLAPYSLENTDRLEESEFGSSFEWRGAIIRLPLPGRFNVYNALAAATTAEHLGVPTSTIRQGLSEASAPPGRMELIDAGQQFRLVVDCAHTPSALKQVLTVLRPDDGKLIVVFGCGGDRDRTKRPEMGALVAHFADVGILTADNPRSEPLDRIFADVLRGTEFGALLVERDRRTAICRAIESASEGDAVLIAGKGDQTIQQIGDRSVPFDDRHVARQAVHGMLAASV